MHRERMRPAPASIGTEAAARGPASHGRNAVSGLDTLRQFISRHARNSHGPTAIKGLTITAADAPTSPRAGVAEPSMGLVIQGRKRTVSGDRVFDYAAGEFLIAQLDLPVTGQVTAASTACPFLGIGIRIEPSEIAAMLLEVADILAGTPARAPGIAVATAGAPLLDALAHLAGDGKIELGDQELAGGVIEYPVAGHGALAALDDESQGRLGDAGARRGRRVGRGDRQPFDGSRPMAVAGVAADELPQRVQS